MINFLNFKDCIQKIQTSGHIPTFRMNLNGYNRVSNLADVAQNHSIKVLSGQIIAMAEQDNQTLIGKNLDIFT